MPTAVTLPTLWPSGPGTEAIPAAAASWSCVLQLAHVGLRAVLLDLVAGAQAQHAAQDETDDRDDDRRLRWFAPYPSLGRVLDSHSPSPQPAGPPSGPTHHYGAQGSLSVYSPSASCVTACSGFSLEAPFTMARTAYTPLEKITMPVDPVLSWILSPTDPGM